MRQALLIFELASIYLNRFARVTFAMPPLGRPLRLHLHFTALAARQHERYSAATLRGALCDV